MRIVSRCFKLLALTSASPLFQMLPHLGTWITQGLISQFSIRISQKKQNASPKLEYFVMVTYSRFWFFVEVSFSLPQEKWPWAVQHQRSCSLRRLWLLGSYLHRELPSWESSHAVGQGWRGADVPQSKAAISFWACDRGSRGLGAVSLPAGLAGEGFHKGIDSQEENIFPMLSSQHASLLFGPSIGKYLPYKNT